MPILRSRNVTEENEVVEVNLREGRATLTVAIKELTTEAGPNPIKSSM